MRRSKPRLYVAFYARPKHPDSYHQALLIGPKNIHAASSEFSKFHVKNTLQIQSGAPTQPWIFEAATIPKLAAEDRLLVLVCIGKIVAKQDAVKQTLKDVRIYQKDDPDKDKAASFSCTTWVRSAVDRLGKEGLVSHLRDWSKSETAATGFVGDLKARGRWEAGYTGDKKIPLLELMD